MRMKMVALIMLLFSFLYIRESVSANTIATTENSGYEVDEVVSKEVLNNGYTINKSVNVKTDEENFIVNDFYYDGYAYLAIGYIQGQESEYYNGYPYISYYENERLCWSKSYSSLGQGEFKSFICKEDYIIVIGEYERNGIVYPFIMNFDYQGNELKQKIFLGLQNCFLNKIYSSYDNYIIVGISFSNEFEFRERSYNGPIFFAYLINESYDRIDLLYFGNNKNNIIYDVVKCGEDIVIYGQTEGEGDLDIKGKNSCRICITITERCEYGNFVIIPDDVLGLTTLVVYQNKVYLVNKSYGDYLINFYEINDSEINYAFRLQDDFNIQTTQRLKISAYEDIIVICDKVNNNGNCYLYISTFKNKKLFYRNIIEESFNFDLVNVLFSACDIIYYGQYISKGTTLFTVYSLLNIKLQENYCTFNGVNVNCESAKMNFEKFGNHIGYDIFSTGFHEVIVDKVVYIPLETNVKDGEMYEINSEIWFNGEGYINNSKVGNSIVLEEEGMYILEIRGENDRVIYKIYVTKISKNLLENEEYKSEKEINFSVYNNNKMDVNKMDYKVSDYQVVQEDENISLYIMIIAIGSGVSLGVLLPIKKRKEVIINV